MSEAVLIALIAGVCGSVPSVIATIFSNKRNNDLITYRIDELSTRVEKHNNIIERVYKLEQNDAVYNEEIKVANHRIDDLERRG